MADPEEVKVSPTDSEFESNELAQVYCSSGSSRGLVSSIHRPHRPVFDRSANGIVVSPVDGANQPVRVPALVPNIRLSNFGTALPSQSLLSKPVVATDLSVIREDSKPTNLKEALKFSLKLCGGACCEEIEITDDKMEIFNAVMGIGHNGNIFKEAIQYLQNETLLNSVSERENVSTVLTDILIDVEDTMTANEFCHLKGMELMVKSFRWKYEQHRILALGIIATVVQNNPVGIEEGNRVGILNSLMTDMLYISMVPENSPTRTELNVKSMYATSCLLRGNSVGCQTFKKGNGVCFLLKILSNNQSPKILKKCYHILSSLIVDETERGVVDTSVLKTDTWLRLFGAVTERFGRMSDELTNALSLAQSLEIICRHYGGESLVKIRSVSKDDGVAMAINKYLDSFYNSDEFDTLSEEKELAKACNSLLNYIEYTDAVTNTGSIPTPTTLPELLSVVNIHD